MKFERRFTQGLELRESKDGPVLSGYAAVFNSESLDLGGFREIVAPGAFAETLKRGDEIVAVIQHDGAAILGRRSKGTLKVEEDGKGLRYDVSLPDTTIARDLATNIKRGDINGSSFKFRTREDRWERVKDYIRRTLLAADLYDVGPVTFPAYPGTNDQLDVRSILEAGQAALAKVEVPDLVARDRFVAAIRARLKLSLWTPAGITG